MDATLQAAIDKTMKESEWADGDEDAEYDEDEEYESEAEEIAKRLGDQLWADIAKAQAEANATANASTPANVSSTAQPNVTLSGAPPPIASHSSIPTAAAAETSSSAIASQSKKQEAALVTVRAILSFAFKDPIVRATLASHQLPNLGSSVLDVLTQCATADKIQKSMAKPLSEAVVSLAKSPVLFSSMRNSDAPAIQLDKGKRKRDTMDIDPSSEDRYQKRPTSTVMIIEYPDILALTTQAVRTIVSAFSSAPPSVWTNGVPDSSFISSIQFHLHQVYLFAVSSAPRARPDQVNLLQELAGLIQMLGVLSKIPIGPAPSPWDSSIPSSSQPPPTDIGTAVYPCLVPGCLKTFHRLYSLRMHQRLHALVDRPYKCTSCPASFARNHDLKRHVKLHDKTAWKCLGCDKVFSRRDAIKRHKDSRSRAHGGKAGSNSQGQADFACANAGIEQVEVEKAEDEEDATRRAKMWNGIVANQMQMASATAAAAEAQAHEGGIVPIMHVENALPDGVKGLEEGEIPTHIIEHAQATVLQLYPIIKARVGPSETLAPPPMQALPGAPHPTLASVIARTQPQYQTSESTPADLPLDKHQAASSDNSLPLSWLTEEQTRLLEQAIAQAASAAQAQAEAEAALEEEEDDEDLGDDDDEVMGTAAS